MSRLPRPVIAVVALVVGVLAGTAAGGAVAANQDERVNPEAGEMPGFPPRDRVRDAIAEVRADGVHVAPDGRSMLDEAGEARVEEAVAAADRVPVHVIVWSASFEIGDDPITIDAQLEAALHEERSVILVWEGPETGRVLHSGGNAYVRVSALDFVGDPASTLPDLVEQVQGTEWTGDGRDGNAGPIAAGIALGTLTGLAAALAAMVLPWLVRRRRNR